MVGVYVRIKRDDRWVSIDFDELTQDEMLVFLREKEPEWVRGLAVILAGWIQLNVNEQGGETNVNRTGQIR